MAGLGSLRSLAGGLSTTALDGNAVTLVLETLGGNQTLDLGGLGVFGLALAGDGTADDELADVVLLVETEETADLGGTLRTETLGDDAVGQTGELALTLLDDAEGQDGKVEVGDGTTDTLALPLSGAAGAVAAVAFTEEQAGTGRKENCKKKKSISFRVALQMLVWLFSVVYIPPCFMGKPIKNQPLAISSLCTFLQKHGISHPYPACRYHQ